ncbi:MAG: hypothetical protein HWE27_18715 [Gammaproteobacteria bacterium]|nr:hypothetical protein [Gammaproteobacteria bacterium]
MRHFFLLLSILIFAVPGMTRTWTDEEAGIRLQELKKERSRANIEQIIAIGKDGPELPLLQNEVFSALNSTGPSALANEFAKEVLDSETAPEMMKYGALGYLAAKPEPWMIPYAEKYLLSDKPAKLRAVASFLATKLNVANAQSTAEAVMNDTAIGIWRVMALYALAEIKTPEEVKALAAGKQLGEREIYNAMSYADFRGASEATKESVLSKWLQTRHPMLEEQALMYMLEKGNAALFVNNKVLPASKRWQAKIRKLGYELTGEATDLSINRLSLDQY